MSHGPVLGNSSSGPTSHLGVHSSQLSMPLSPPSRHQTPTKVSAAADFFEGITKDMSSTSRGPLTKLSAGSDKVFKHGNHMKTIKVKENHTISYQSHIALYKPYVIHMKFFNQVGKIMHHV